MVEPRAYYNEHDKYAAAWLRNLIAAGHIAPGDVDERDIRDVRPDDLRRYVQCHFFAGVGVWSHSLRRAGWPDRRRVWTASCPCQPFSAAGQGGGFDDERHLWPAFFHLVSECGPTELFGEQVASKDGLAWLDLVQSDMEGEGYAFGALDMCAAGFGAPHIRQRLYWMADAAERRSRALDRQPGSSFQSQIADRGHGIFGLLADADDERSQGRFGVPERRDQRAARALGLAGELGHTDDERGGRHAGTVSSAEGSTERGLWRVANGGESASAVGALADTASFGERADEPGRDRRDGQFVARAEQGRDRRDDGAALTLADPEGARGWPDTGTIRSWPSEGLRDAEGEDVRRAEQQNRRLVDCGSNAPTGPVNGIWRDADWLLCRDGKWRPVRSGTFPLAHGAAARVGRLRAYGNAIVAPQAEEFIGAYLDVEHLRLSLTTGIFA